MAIRRIAGTCLALASLLGVIALAMGWLISLPCDYGVYSENWSVSCREGRILAWYGRGHGRELRSTEEAIIGPLRFEVAGQWSGVGFRFPKLQVIHGVKYLIVPFWLPISLLFLVKKYVVRRGSLQKGGVSQFSFIRRMKMRRVFAATSGLACVFLTAAALFSIEYIVEYAGQQLDVTLDSGCLLVALGSPGANPSWITTGCFTCGAQYVPPAGSATSPAALLASSNPYLNTSATCPNVKKWGPLQFQTKSSVPSGLRACLGLVSPGGAFRHGTGGPEYVITIPVWSLVLAIVAAGMVVLKPWRRRYPPGHCQGCGYDLTCNETGICPECGKAIESPRQAGGAGSPTSLPMVGADRRPG